MEYTKRLAELACGVEYENLPSEVIKRSKEAMLDTIGVTLAGSEEESARIIAEYVRELGGNPQATIINKKMKSSVFNAAMVNGAMGHILDYDDVSLTILGHPALAVFPAVMAIAEKEHYSGKDIITAFVTGYEVIASLGRGLVPAFCNQGWHSTATLGTFGAAAAVGKLLGFGVDQMVTALGTSGSEAAGIKGNMGTMTKHLQVGRASADGIRAALLTQKGYTSSPAIFEGKDGFCKVFAKEFDLNKMVSNFGEPYDLVDVGATFKKWPSCYATAPTLEATSWLVENYDIKPDQVKHVTVSAPYFVKDVLFYTEPKTVFEAKFSAAFCVAVTLVKRQAYLSEFKDEVVQSPEIQELIKKVDHIIGPEFKDIGYAPPADEGPSRTKVIIELNDGRTLEKEIQFPKGSPQRRLSETEVVEKYINCASLVMDKDKIDQTVDIVLNLEKDTSIGKLISLLAG